MSEWYSQDEHSEIESLLLGHSAAKVEENRLVLDDGTLLIFEGNDGCGDCSSGTYDLTELNGVDNIITNVEFLNQPSDNKDGSGLYQIFVYADNVKINLATFQGDDGNGYYGTGYSITVGRQR